MSDHEYWYRWYAEPSSPRPFGDTVTYEIVADFLDGTAVEDWGCGYGWYKTIHRGPYIGVDGVKTGHEDIVADLSEYTSSTPSIFMRGVLEHNYNWRKILENCCVSAQEKIAIVVATPRGEGEVVNFLGGVRQIPDIALPWDEIFDILKQHGWSGKFAEIETKTHYYKEGIWLAEKVDKQ